MSACTKSSVKITTKPFHLEKGSQFPRPLKPTPSGYDLLDLLQPWQNQVWLSNYRFPGILRWFVDATESIATTAKHSAAAHEAIAFSMKRLASPYIDLLAIAWLSKGLRSGCESAAGIEQLESELTVEINFIEQIMLVWKTTPARAYLYIALHGHIGWQMSLKGAYYYPQPSQGHSSRDLNTELDSEILATSNGNREKIDLVLYWKLVSSLSTYRADLFVERRILCIKYLWITAFIWCNNFENNPGCQSGNERRAMKALHWER